MKLYSKIQGGGNNIIEAYDNTGASKFVIQNGGNVGIGTSTPLQTLQVNNGSIGLGPNGGQVWPVISRDASTGGLLNQLASARQGVAPGGPERPPEWVRCYRSGPLGGDAQIAREILEGHAPMPLPDDAQAQIRSIVADADRELGGR